jgi:glutamate decarboxylase
MIRLGQQGYRDVMEALAATARWLAAEVEGLGGFELLGRAEDLPVVCFRLAGDHPFTVFDLSDRLRQRGWIVPAYKMAPDADDIAVLRVVVREGLSADMAAELVADLQAAVAHLGTGNEEPAAPTRRAGQRARTPAVATGVKTRGVC